MTSRNTRKHRERHRWSSVAKATFEQVIDGSYPSPKFDARTEELASKPVRRHHQSCHRAAFGVGSLFAGTALVDGETLLPALAPAAATATVAAPALVTGTAAFRFIPRLASPPSPSPSMYFSTRPYADGRRGNGNNIKSWQISGAVLARTPRRTRLVQGARDDIPRTPIWWWGTHNTSLFFAPRRREQKKVHHNVNAPRAQRLLCAWKYFKNSRLYPPRTTAWEVATQHDERRSLGLR